MTTITVHARKFTSMLGIAKPEVDEEGKQEDERIREENARDRYNVQEPSPHIIAVKKSSACVIL